MGLRRDDIRLPDPRTTIVGRERAVRHPATGARRQDACEYDGGANRRCLLTAPRQAGLLVRLFTAIEIPTSWRDEAVRLQRRLASDFEEDLRFVAAEQLHVTVRFLGEVADERAADLSQTIEAIPPLSPTLTLEAAGTFGRGGRPNVVWLGVGIDTDDTTELLREVDQAITVAELVPQEAAWKPHLTLARVRRQVGAKRRELLADAVRSLSVPPPQSIAETTVALYRSDLGNRAPIHKLLARSAVS